MGEEMIGQRFGKLEVIGVEGTRGGILVCRCDCGAVVKVYKSRLFNGNNKSCGCEKREQLGRSTITHGARMGGKTPSSYTVWASMKQRCYNPNAGEYHRYGGRGITVCERWLSYENFVADMGEPPKGLTLDRVDNNLGYCFENCRWTTYSAQNRNRESTLWLEYNGELLRTWDLAERLQLKISALYDRLYRHRKDPVRYPYEWVCSVNPSVLREAKNADN